MNYLEICKRVRQEAGISGDGPSNVSGQTGIYAKIVDWVKAAHQEVQLSNSHWRFDWAEYQTTLTEGQSKYSFPIDVREWDWDSLYVYLTIPASRTWLTHCDYDSYRKMSQTGSPGLPSYATLAPDKGLAFYPIPISSVKFVGEYYKKPEVLVNTTDTPRMPAEYHMAIVWKAVMLYCAYDENISLFQAATAQYNAVMLRMAVTELDGPSFAGTLV